MLYANKEKVFDIKYNQISNVKFNSDNLKQIVIFDTLYYVLTVDNEIIIISREKSELYINIKHNENIKQICQFGPGLLILFESGLLSRFELINLENKEYRDTCQLLTIRQ